MELTDIVLAATGIWQITVALIMSTKNVQSALVFKVVPMFLGLGCLYAWLVI